MTVAKHEIAFHLGAPHTDNDQLTWSLRKDTELLHENGVLARRPGTYRKLLNEKVNELDGCQASPAEQDELLSTIVKDQPVNRLILSNSKFMGIPAWMFNNGIFYKNAGTNMARLQNLFPDHPCEIFLAIRDPATFVPETYLAQDEKGYDDFINGISLLDIRWSDVIASIQQANPDCPITVWCNEDSPVIWSTVLRKISGLKPDTYFKGGLDIINTIMSPEGGERLITYLQENPNLSEAQCHEVKAIFLEKFAISSAVEDVIDLHGWTDAIVDELTECYEDDIELIERMPGVDFIAPQPG